MKTKIFMAIALVVLSFACSSKKESKNISDIKQELIKTEEDFAALAKNKGITEAFYYFADDSAVIIRRNSSVIKGKENIKKYYSDNNSNVELNWKADFADVSADGTLGYTYGKFTGTVKDADGKRSEVSGIFHTVWKRQSDGSWKYVWD